MEWSDTSDDREERGVLGEGNVLEDWWASESWGRHSALAPTGGTNLM